MSNVNDMNKEVVEDVFEEIVKDASTEPIELVCAEVTKAKLSPKAKGVAIGATTIGTIVLLAIANKEKIDKWIKDRKDAKKQKKKTEALDLLLNEGYEIYEPAKTETPDDVDDSNEN